MTGRCQARFMYGQTNLSTIMDRMVLELTPTLLASDDARLRTVVEKQSTWTTANMPIDYRNLQRLLVFIIILTFVAIH